ncbi:DUF4266 domain-containing protein [Pseudenhygromyxa sp. WMMC2535]|nr:DUF4266 domain-containing protein [Pseudenhygromyxa sp. WMMC2535]
MAVGAGLLALLGLRTRRRRRPHQGRGRPASLERGQLRSPSARELLHEPPALPRRPGRPARLALLGASLLPCLALLGCVRVQPWERERLAQPDMQMAVDPELSAGPDHAVEYREGSAGAFGGAGGGCGCN